MTLSLEQLKKLQDLEQFKESLPVSTGQPVPLPEQVPVVEKSLEILSAHFSKTQGDVVDRVAAKACATKRDNFAALVEGNKEFFETANNWCYPKTHTWHAKVQVKGDSFHRYYNDGTYFQSKKSVCILQSQQLDLNYTGDLVTGSASGLGLNVESLFLNFFFEDYIFFPLIFASTFWFTYKLFITIYKNLTNLNYFFAVLAFLLLFHFISIIFSYTIGLIAFILAILSSNIIILFIGWNL